MSESGVGPKTAGGAACLIHFEQVRQLFQGLSKSLAGNLVGTGVAWYLIADKAATVALYAWLAVALGVTMARIGLAVAFAYGQPGPEDGNAWERAFLVGALGNGLTWTVFTLFLFPADALDQMIILVMLAGISAGGMATLSARMRAYLLFMLPMQLPLVVHYVPPTKATDVVMAAMIVAYAVFLAATSRAMGLTILENLQRRFRMDALVDELSAAHDKEHTASEVIHRMMHELKTIFDMATVGIAYVRGARIVRANERMERMFGYGVEALSNASVYALNPTLSGEQSAAIVEALARGQTYQGDYLLTRRDGSQFWCEVTASASNPARRAAHGDMIMVFTDIDERVRSDQRIRHLAHHDSLTGLPNRLLLMDRMEMALANARRDGERVAVLLIDLDRFKQVNDTLGHAAGDRLLQAVAARMRGCVREPDTVARLGGDEFVLVLPGVREIGDCDVVVGKLNESLGHPVAFGEHKMLTRPSIGIAIFPDDADSSEGLLKHADNAMYRVKQRGRDLRCPAEAAGAAVRGPLLAA